MRHDGARFGWTDAGGMNDLGNNLHTMAHVGRLADVVDI